MEQTTNSEKNTDVFNDDMLAEILSTVKVESEKKQPTTLVGNINELKKKAIYYYNSNRFQEALKTVEDAIRILPGDLELNFFEAQCLYRINELDRAEIILKNLLNLDDKGKFLPLPRLYALVLLKANKFSRAEKNLKSLIQIYKNDIQLRNMLAFSYEKQDKLNDALNVLQDILREDKNNPNACNSLAYIYYRKESDLDKALELIKFALKKEPENPAFMDTYAMLLHKSGKENEAIEILKKALQLDPKNSGLLIHISELLQKK